MPDSSNPYQRVTTAILAQLDSADPGTWTCPWHHTGGGLPTNALTGRSYRGINIVSLWCGARGAGYADDRWATYRQWTQLGAQVRKGEAGTLVIFYKDLASATGTRASAARPTRPNHSIDASTDTDPDDTGRARILARASFVFNAAQVDGLPAPSVNPEQPAPELTPTFDAFVSATGATIRHGGERASYSPREDLIRLPPRESFHTADGYTATLAHELVHWSGAKHRLARDLARRFGTQAYAAEELVAELGSAFVLAGLGLAATPHPQHAVYMAGWLPLLRTDPRALFTAAAQASRAADWLQAAAATSAPATARETAIETLASEPEWAGSPPNLL